MDAQEATFLTQLTLNLVRLFVLMNVWMSSNWVNWGHKVGHLVKLNKYLVDTFKATFLTQLSLQLLRILVTWCHKLGQYIKIFYYPTTRQQNFRLVQIETNCRQHFKVH